MPPTLRSPSGLNHSPSRHGAARLPHPLLYRILSTVLPLFATLLLLTTVYLFHLHHAHHHPEDDAANLDKLGQDAGGGANSPGGSALRHKMDLAQFLLQKYEPEKVMDQGDMKEAMELGGWKGGDEEHFIKMVKEAQEGGNSETLSRLSNNELKLNKQSINNKNVGVSVSENLGHLSNHLLKLDDKSNNSNSDGSLLKLNKQSINNNNGGVSVSENLSHLKLKLDERSINSNSGGIENTNEKRWEDAEKYAASLSKLSWRQLQQTLLEENLLPPPIPPMHTARGFSGLPPARTPALEGARRGTIACPDTDPRVGRVLSSMLAFWNEPRGTRDQNAGSSGAEAHVFVPPPLADADLFQWSPGRVPRRRYLTFEPDTGGWNNLRISFENVLLLAAVSGRTLVLPPDQNMYLLEPRKGARRERNYDELVNMTKDLLLRVPVISSRDFMRLEGHKGGLAPVEQYNATWQNHLTQITIKCEQRKLSDVYCEDLYDHYRTHGQLATVSTDQPTENCFVFDADVFRHGEDHVAKLAPEIRARIKNFCRQRTPVYYNRTVHEAPLWHFETMDERYRLLVHSYAFLFFTDPKVGNYYKRFVRDFVKFHDKVYCAAGKIILALQYEDYLRNKALAAKENNESSLSLDLELVGGYSSLHIRRGDLQFNEVKFDSAQWYQNTKEMWRPNEVLYVATDESDQSWFDGFRKQHSGPLRFFGDYNKLADLDSLDPTLYGLIETVVASRGSVFVGTWFSTFSGYIIRLRGYYGMSRYYTYYSWLERKYFMRDWMDVGDGSYYAGEYPIGWTSIDGDEFVDHGTEEEVSSRHFSRNLIDGYKAAATTRLVNNRYSVAEHENNQQQQL